MVAFTPAELLTIFGLTLMICGALAFQESGLLKSAMSAIYVGNGGALISFMIAAGCRDTTLKKGDSGYKIMMITVHLAIIWPLIMAGGVGWRLWLAWNVPEKKYLRVYFSIIVAVSLLTSGGIAALKPKKKKEEGKKKEGESMSSGVETSAKGGVVKRKGKRVASS